MVTTFRLLVVFLGSLLCAVALGCSKKVDSAKPGEAEAPHAAAKGLPPLVLGDDTKHLMLTWVDESGDFKVVEKIADVPASQRTQVRVVVVGQDAGTGEAVYVADLTQKDAAGHYSVKSMSRTDWDGVGAAKRKARLEQLAPGSEKAEQAAANLADGPIIIYGASWCKPCHDAENYLRGKGLKVVKKDIEEDPLANQEMREKLQRSHLPGASIPIIDIRGRLLVGFSAGAIDEALQATGKTKTL
ncbi:MAG: glutaredoxin domain-containing protein [Polyangiaceae bacterium]|nr:glutaredoxin domain-containing protein [Polyangiaceae bacterium]